MAHLKPLRLEHMGASALASPIIMTPANAKANADRMNVDTNPAVFLVLLDDMITSMIVVDSIRLTVNKVTRPNGRR